MSLSPFLRRSSRPIVHGADLILTSTMTTLPPLTSKVPAGPLILILGATGTGKSNLALSIAHSLPAGAEIINCDAMQMYTGLPIITNKLPKHERQGIPHHLLDLVGLDAMPWTANKFRRESSRIIDEIRARGKIPVMVGGTGHYAFGSLFRDSMLDDDARGNEGTEGLSDGEKQKFGEGQEHFEILNGSVEEMYEKLKELDPEMARTWHPKDRRRIQRSLEICLKRGRKVSEIYREQVQGLNGTKQTESMNQQVAGLALNSEEDNTTHETLGPLYHSPLIFWLSASDQPLKTRLNTRVDTMVQDGLFEEALELVRLHQQYKLQGVKIDTTKGIWVSIGYKELEPWATNHLQNNTAYPKDCPLANECIDSVKARTRQYAKRQDRYIRIRLANALRNAGALDRLFLLDGTDLDHWQERVIQPATQILETFMKGPELPDASSLGGLAKETFDRIKEQGECASDRMARYCEVCEKTTMTEKEWMRHLGSRGHKKVVQARRRRALVRVDQEVVPMSTREAEV